jgi:uncharacterized membrane protein
MSEEAGKAHAGNSSVRHRLHRAINARWVIRSHTLARWDGLKHSLWFRPTLITIAFYLLVLVMIKVDHFIATEYPDAYDSFQSSASAEGARTVLTLTAGTLIAVVATVFSVTIVALQLASAQYTPRLIRSFTGDRGVQLTLGVFIGSFVYILRLVGEIYPDPSRGDDFIPHLSIALASIITLMDVGFLIYFIHHAATTIQAPVIIERATEQVDQIRRSVVPSTPEWEGEQLRPTVTSAVIYCPESGYIQDIDERRLSRAASKAGVTVRLERMMGDFVLPDTPIATVWPADIAPKEIEKALRSTIVLGRERTTNQDFEFGLRILAEIAMKALSAAINDPSTAMTCIDRICQSLVTGAETYRGPLVHLGKDGRGMVIVPRPEPQRLLDVAFTGIRFYGSGDPMVAPHLCMMLGETARLMPGLWLPLLAQQATLVVTQARHSSNLLPEDIQAIEQAASWVES